MDDVLDLGSMSDPEPDDHDHDHEPPDRRGHWLADLLRADVLALSGAVLLAVTALGTFAFGDFQVSSLAGGRELSAAVIYLPQIAAFGVASLLGFVGLRNAVHADSKGWVRAVAGVAAIVGLLAAAGFVAKVLVADAEGLFDPLQF